MNQYRAKLRQNEADIATLKSYREKFIQCEHIASKAHQEAAKYKLESQELRNENRSLQAGIKKAEDRFQRVCNLAITFGTYCIFFITGSYINFFVLVTIRARISKLGNDWN